MSLKCDASEVDLNRSYPNPIKETIAYFSKKLNGFRCNYGTYDKVLCAITRALTHWGHCLKARPFILYSNHHAIKYINGQHKLNPRHAKWVEFLQ